jgi:hypothetical protein
MLVRSVAPPRAPRPLWIRLSRCLRLFILRDRHSVTSAARPWGGVFVFDTGTRHRKIMRDFAYVYVFAHNTPL